MKNIFRLCICAGCLFGFAGCNLTGTSTAQLIAEVQTATVAACAVEPTAASVAALIAAANPTATAGVAIASQIAKSICGAVEAKASRSQSVSADRIPAPVVIHGVDIIFEPIGSGK